MDVPDKRFSDLVGIVKSWIPRRTNPASVSRDFWMPDQSCRVCYDCDSPFTILNRRHHCRLCGRVFCAKCTANSIPTAYYESKTGREEWERIRVCNYCFKQWEQGIATVDNGIRASGPGLSPSASATSLASSKSSGTGHSSSSAGSVPYSTGSYKCFTYGSGHSPHQSAQMEPAADKQGMVAPARNMGVVDIGNPSSNHFEYCINRSDDDDDEFSVYRSDSETRHFPAVEDSYDPLDFDEISHTYGSLKVHPDGENIVAKVFSGSPSHECLDSHGLEVNKLKKESGHVNGNEFDAASIYGMEAADSEPMDFESNMALWIPPDPEDKEDDREVDLFDDEEDDATGEWGELRSSSSFGSGGYRSRDRSSEEHKKAMNNVVGGHFRALVAQLLQVENLPVGEEDGKESWLELITSLSWEAATLLKPDTSKGGGMDPGGYVKIKCIACGHRCESMVVKGIVCKKNVAHRRMTSKIEKPRFLILGGALEYQRVSNLLSSFDTLLQQEMDHLKMAVAKIESHHPNVLLVEKTVSRFAQEYLLATDISLVLNVKRPLLERIARCTGAEIVPSVDHLLSQKLGFCELFHVEKFFEEHGTAGQGGKKLTKTLMFFEGCPKPLGCTILLKGANGDELKKVKHVVQYAVFAAYHLALETSFLADEGASMPELPLESPITVGFPDKSSRIEKSISMIPGFTVPATGEPQGPQGSNRSYRSDLEPVSHDSGSKIDIALPTPSKGCGSQYRDSTPSFMNSSCFSSLSAPEPIVPGPDSNKHSPHNSFEEKDEKGFEESFRVKNFGINCDQSAGDDLTANGFRALEVSGPNIIINEVHVDQDANQQGSSELVALQQDTRKYFKEPGFSKEEFPPSPSDHQSILVSLSMRCVWKGTVCERAHLFRIKYYGSFDKPLGRFLRDHLFDQSYRCRSCEMPSEAHVHCYTHQQGSLTISVKKLPEFFLPGEREGKIWMWHRCLRCPRINSFPPATRRVVMSDAAWGLSFGKFLELSFSNHAAASRVASCGHSLHRDCLRFYGFGRMVACFRYASIDVHSVYLPPSKLDFNYEIQEWIQKEADEVVDRADLLFTEVLNTLHHIAEKRSGVMSPNSGMKTPQSKRRITELEGILQREKAEFEESLQKALKREPKKGQPVIDLLEINQLQRQLLFQSFLWDHRLINAASLDNNSLHLSFSSLIRNAKEKSLMPIEKLVEMDATSKPSKAFSSSSCDSFLMDAKPEKESNCLGQIDDSANQRSIVPQGRVMDQELNKGNEAHALDNRNICNHSDPPDSGVIVRRALSEGQFPIMENLSDTLDAAWTGENPPASVSLKEDGFAFPDPAIPDSTVKETVAPRSDLEDHMDKHCGAEDSTRHPLTINRSENIEDPMSWVGMPFSDFYRQFSKNSAASAQKLDMVGEYNPIYISSFRDLKCQGGARLLLPMGVNDTFVPVYDDEPTSIISHALISSDYHVQMSDEGDRPKDSGDSFVLSPLSDSVNPHSLHALDDTASESFRSLGSTDESILSVSGSRSSLALDPLSYTKALHVRVSFTSEGPLGKVKYTVTCYCAKRFEALRKICCSSELDFVRSLSRCKKWGAQGGKSNVFFAKTLDDRFIIKQVTKTELESFIKFAPGYFKYLSESISTGCPTCLAKILGIYQVTLKHLKGGKESRMDVLVMENLLFRRNFTRLYDLKGSSRSRYNPDSSGSNKVLLDQNLIEAMPTSPIFVGNKAKRLLERAVWNDTSFLASIDVMDYSLLVGVDEEKHELVLGIIDFMRQYTWDKHLETWVKASGILGGSNSSPTVISPKQYKRRFRKAMSAYFLMVPDQWSPRTIVPSGSQSDLCEDNTKGGNSLD